MQSISPFLWLDHQAGPAAQHPLSILEGSRATGVSRYGAGAPAPAGTAMAASFELDGAPFEALDAGPVLRSTEATSCFVRTEAQVDIDRLSEWLTSDGGEPGRCGWLKNSCGLSWQIVPSIFAELLGDPDRATTSRVQQPVSTMGKIDVRALRAAGAGLAHVPE